ncbi:TMEM43 family protein [bacterium]|nr:TMEM43 family protein [bacterium]
MSDSYTKTTTTSLGSRLGSSLIGVIVGIVLFIAAFPLIFWNEGRAIKRTKSLNEGQQVCVTVDNSQAVPENEGKLIHTSGSVKTAETLSDTMFGQTVSNALSFSRTVMMYQWQEHEKSETKKKTGGSTETKTTYTYTKEWVDHPVSSSSFEKEEGHENPTEWPVEGETWQVGNAQLGAFELSREQIERAGKEEPFKPFVTNNMPLPQGLDSAYVRTSEGFYRGTDPQSVNPGSPKIGDIKVTFEVTPVCAISMAGAQVGNTIAPYQTKFGTILLQYNGTMTKEDIFAAAHRDNAILTWLLRVAALLMFFIGLKLIIGPLNVLADIIPFFGNIMDFVTGTATFLIALVLTLITVAIAWLTVRPVIGIALIVIAALLIFLAKKKKKVTKQPQEQAQ